jgi:hypothetical protein
MRTTFSGILTTVLSIICVILIAATAVSLYFIFQTSLPAAELNESGIYIYLQTFRIPILAIAALLYVITLLFFDLRIQQLNSSLMLLNREVESTEKPLLFIKSSKITFETSPASGKIAFKYNGEFNPAVEIINAGKEPALEVRIKFIFDYTSSIKMIRSNDVFHLFNISENDEEIILTSEKIGYSSTQSLLSLKSWQKTSFILSASQITSYTRIAFPDIYLALFYWYNELTDGEKTNDFPGLNCHVEYKRLDGTILKQTFKLNLEEVNYAPGLRGDRLYESSSVFSTSVSLA